MELAANLGIKLQRAKTSFRGVGNDKLIGYWSEVSIKIGEYEYKTKAIFAEISDFGHGILGQKGFFDHFNVNLNYNKQIIELKNN